MTRTIEYTETLVVVQCWCGTNHGVPEGLRAYQLRMHRDGGEVPSIYCPHGHAHSPAGPGKAAELAAELERAQAARARAVAAREQAEASARAYKGVATRAKRRAAAAVCPCCNRSFVQLRRHLETKHPEYRPE